MMFVQWLGIGICEANQYYYNLTTIFFRFPFLQCILVKCKIDCVEKISKLLSVRGNKRRNQNNKRTSTKEWQKTVCVQ